MTPMPGSGLSGDPGTGVLWLVRVEPGTANLAESYASLVAKMNAGLQAAGFDVRTTAVASLYDERLLWARSDGLTIGLSSALSSAAASASTAAPTACSTASLAGLGARLSTVYPESGSSGSPPFAPSRGALLVGVLDHRARPVSYYGGACTHFGQLPDSYFGVQTSSQMVWLNRSTFSWSLPLKQTRFALVSTSESESASAQRSRCAALAAFPRSALDVIAPSSNPFYGPFASAMVQHRSELATSYDLCNALGQDFAPTASAFARSWASALQPSDGTK
ncbi:hypothetical protein FGE12_06735 [Aggregicoccus sp. 17bor-14]|nr:hypothetical protein [Aggregicoccus sp. 17bor-14]